MNLLKSSENTPPDFTPPTALTIEKIRKVKKLLDEADRLQPIRWDWVFKLTMYFFHLEWVQDLEPIRGKHMRNGKPSNARAIGAEFEREVARMLTADGFAAVRGQQRSGRDSDDVYCAGLDHLFNIECKRRKGRFATLYDAIAQCHRDADMMQTPLVYIHEPAPPGKVRRPVLVVMEYDDHIELLKAFMELRALRAKGEKSDVAKSGV